MEISLPMSSAFRRLFVVIIVSSLAAAPSRAQNTRSWTGLAAPDKNWTTLGNWNTGVPVSGDTALFNGSGNTNTSISLGGAAHSSKSFRVDRGRRAPSMVRGGGPGGKIYYA